MDSHVQEDLERLFLEPFPSKDIFFGVAIQGYTLTLQVLHGLWVLHPQIPFHFFIRGMICEMFYPFDHASKFLMYYKIKHTHAAHICPSPSNKTNGDNFCTVYFPLHFVS